MGKHRDWTEIREDYQANGLNYAALAQKYGVPLDTLKKAAARQGWTKRKEKRQEKQQAAVKKISAKMAPPENGTEEMAPAQSNFGQAEQFDRTVAKLLTKVEQAVDFMPPESTQALKQLTGALKDLQGLLRMTKDDLDREEQRARIEKLRAEIETGVPAGPVVIKFVNTEGAEE